MDLVIGNKIITTPMETILFQLQSELNSYNGKLKEIGRLKGICLAQFTKYSIKSFKNGLEDAMKEMEGIMEGFTQGLKDIDEE